MSKHLIKLISICAFAVLLPLIIVGSALCVTEAIPCTLSIHQIGKKGSYLSLDKTPEIFIKVNDEIQKDKEGNFVTKVSLQKHDEVEVCISNADAYDFAGWYKGNLQEIGEKNKAKDKRVSYGFKLRGNTHLTAVRNVKTYKVQYQGFYADGVTPIEAKEETLEYGQPLWNPTPKGSEVLTGWYIVTEGTDAPVDGVKVANWDKSTVGEEKYVLNPTWNQPMTINYYDFVSKTPIYSHNVSKDELAKYEFISQDNESFKAFMETKKGYSFDSFVDKDGNAINVREAQFVEGASIDVYVKTKLNVYNINVAKYEGSEEVITMTYDVENGYSAQEFTRPGFTFIGLLYEANLYAPDSVKNDYVANEVTNLSDQIIIHGVETPIELVAAWSEETMTLIYFDKETNQNILDPIAITLAQYNDYTLIDGATHSAVQKAIKKGYSFDKWVDGNNDPIVSLKESVEYVKGNEFKIYLTTKLNNYSFKYQINPLVEEFLSLKYDVENGFENNVTTRAGYTFDGFEKDNQVYKYDVDKKDYVYGEKLLSDSIIEKGINPETPLTVTAKWVCEYGEYNWKVEFKDVGNNSVYKLDESHAKYDANILRNTSVSFDDDAALNTQLSDKILSKCAREAIDFENVAVKAGVEYKKATLKYITVKSNLDTMNGYQIVLSGNSDVTYLQVLEEYKEQIALNVNIDFNNLTDLTITYSFAEAVNA